MILKLYVNYQLRMNDVVSQGNIKQDQTASLKVELLLDDFLTIFKMDQTFIKDSPHQTESLIWRHHIPEAFIIIQIVYFISSNHMLYALYPQSLSNYTLKMDGMAR